MLNFNNKTINRAFTSRIDTRSLFSVSDITLDYDLKLGTTVYPPNTTLKKVLNKLSAEVTTLMSGGDGNGIYGGSGIVPDATIVTLDGEFTLYAGENLIYFDGGDFTIGDDTNTYATYIKGIASMYGANQSVNFNVDDLGLFYQDDYSATIMANDRSIPDVGTVNQLIAAGSGIYGGDGTVSDGTVATVLGNFSIEQDDDFDSNYGLFITNGGGIIPGPNETGAGLVVTNTVAPVNTSKIYVSSDGSSTGSTMRSSSATSVSVIEATNGNSYISYEDPDASYSIRLDEFGPIYQAITFGGNDSRKGFQYYDDYSVILKTNDRSIPDVGTIKQMDGYRPYKVYVALLSQTGTGDPVATVLENTLGTTLTPSRTNVGQYLLTLGTGTFDFDKTTCIISQQQDNLVYPDECGYRSVFVNSTSIGIRTIGVDLISSDNRLSYTMIEIRVYP